MIVGVILGGLQQLWEDRPGMVVLMSLGLLIFLFLVFDAWRHKHRPKK